MYFVTSLVNEIHSCFFVHLLIGRKNKMKQTDWTIFMLVQPTRGGKKVVFDFLFFSGLRLMFIWNNFFVFISSWVTTHVHMGSWRELHTAPLSTRTHLHVLHLHNFGLLPLSHPFTTGPVSVMYWVHLDKQDRMRSWFLLWEGKPKIRMERLRSGLIRR